MRDINIILEGEAEKEYSRLEKIVEDEIKKGKKKSHNQTLLRSIKSKIEIIRRNHSYGARVPKILIPDYMKVDNLWVVDLSGSWRMLYTLKGNRIEILCFILDIMDHDKYNKIFGYKKK